jgi:hypothetical protein
MSDLEKELETLEIVKENLDWFTKHRVKNHITIDDPVWFETIISDEDFKEKIMSRYRIKRLERILKKINKKSC